MYRIKGIALIVLLCCLGCGNDTPVEPESTVNTAPKIDALILPQKVEAGSTVNLQVVARDAENDNLTINWQVSEGHVDIATSIWTAPKDTTTVEITVFVSDRSNEAVSAKKSVEVIDTTPPPEPPPPPPVVSTPLEPVVPEPVVPEPEPVGQEDARIILRLGLVLITPGLENLGVSVEQSIDELRRLYGEPVKRVGSELLYFDAPRIGAFAVSPENNKVRSILIADPRYKTAEGIGIGSDRAEVLKAYGKPHVEDAVNRFDHYDFKGISFAYDANWQVILIAIR